MKCGVTEYPPERSGKALSKFLKAHMQRSENYGQALANTADVADWIDERWSEHLDLQNERKLAVASFSIARAHHRGILTLLKMDARTAALALVRPLFEAAMRGQWFLYCANLQQVVQTDEGHLTGLRRMAIQLSKKGLQSELPQLESEDVSVRMPTVQDLNEYTHGGKRQIFSWFDGATIKESHPDLSVMLLLEFANKVVMHAARGAAEVAGKDLTEYSEKLQDLDDAFLLTAADELAEKHAAVDEAIAELSALYNRYNELIGGL